MGEKICLINYMLFILLFFCGSQLVYAQTNVEGKTETFYLEKEYLHQGKNYQLGRLQLKDSTYSSLSLRIKEGDQTLRDHVAPAVQYLEISQVQLIMLKERPFFFVKGRYELFLVDLQGEEIAPLIRPGVDVSYREDALSGQMNGFQFFDEDNYLLGIAVSYGVFCFNISDLAKPKELLRYSSDFSDQGQPYFFLEKNAQGRYNGIIAQSDTTEKSMHISGFYTKTKEARYLFQDAHIVVPDQVYADPADYETGHTRNFLQFQQIGPRGAQSPWVINLKKGELLEGKEAENFLKKQ